MNGEAETQRSLGRLEARADSYEDRLSRIEGKLDHVVKVMDQAKGGWRMLVAVGAAAASAGAGVASLFNWIRHP